MSIAARFDIALGELMARDDYIFLLKEQLRAAGLDPVEYRGPRGRDSFTTDNHIRGLIFQLDQIDRLEYAAKHADRTAALVEPPQPALF